MWILTAGWFVACSSDEDFTDILPDTTAQKAIAFGSTLGDMQDAKFSAHKGGRPGLRAADTPLHEKGVTEFHVWGYKNSELEGDRYGGHQQVFNGYTVKYNGTPGTLDNTNGWYYVGAEGSDQTIKYWDFGAKAYRFIAVTGDINKVLHYPAWPLGENWVSTTLISDIDAQTDTYFSRLWFSNNDPSDPEMAEFGKPVKLSFFQPFCRVRFMLVDELGKPLTKSSEVTSHIDKESILFEVITSDDQRRFADYGNFWIEYFLTGTKEEAQEVFKPDPAPRPDPLDPDAEPTYVTIDTPYESHANDADYALVAPSEKEKWYRLFPNDYTECYFKLSLKYDGKVRTAIIPSNYTLWQVNHEYTYVFKIGHQDMKFQPDLFVQKEWQTGYTTDVPVEW